eukprot:1160444-Pelagomonas_calceolata.AAC.5
MVQKWHVCTRSEMFSRGFFFLLSFFHFKSTVAWAVCPPPGDFCFVNLHKGGLMTQLLNARKKHLIINTAKSEVVHISSAFNKAKSAENAFRAMLTSDG